MAISGANLIGANPVYDTSKSVGTYTANLQRQAAQRAAEQKALQDDLGKIKIDGLRDADKEDYFKGFEDWRNTAQSAFKEKDFRKKAQLQSESDKKYLELQSLVNKSKEYNKLHQDVSGRFLDDRFRDQFSDDAVERWRRSGSLPLSSKEIVLDPTALERQLDFNKINTEFSKINDYLKKNAVDSNQPLLEDVTLAGDKGVKITPYAKVDPNIQAQKYAEIFDNDRDFKKMWMQQRPDLFENPNLSFEEAKLTLIDDLIKNNPLERRGSSTYKWKDKWADRMLFNDALIRKRKADGVGEDVSNMIPKNLQLPFGTPEAPRVTTVRNAVFAPSANKNFVGSDAIDLATGKPTRLTNSSNDYEMVAFVEVPTIEGGKITERRNGKVVKETPAEGVIAQEDFVKKNPNKVKYKPMIQVTMKDPYDSNVKLNYLVPYEMKPDNLTKKDQALAAQFEKSIGYNKPQSAPKQSNTPQSTKMVTMILPDGQSGQIPESKVKDFLKKYPKAKKQ